MSGVWGNNIKISIFGESHGEAIGIVLDGIKPGLTIDVEAIKKDMSRRAPGQDSMSTTRKEKDIPHILSGIFEGKTTGAPIAMMIANTNTQSKDYSKTKAIARPGHADYTGYVKYKGFNDYRGGGHFSGRITAPLVFAGAIAKQVLEQKGVHIGAHIKQIAHVKDTSFDECQLTQDLFDELKGRVLPVVDEGCIQLMRETVEEVKKEGDSVGGVIECAAIGIDAGLGEPFFDSVESHIAQLAFSVPAVKGIEFGMGFEIVNHRGSVTNDAYCIEEGKVKTKTNHNGGVVGGITNGMPILFRVAIKPTPSIAKKQQSIHMETLEETSIQIQGRHDPCIVQRAVVVIEAITALALLDLI